MILVCNLIVRLHSDAVFLLLFFFWEDANLYALAASTIQNTITRSKVVNPLGSFGLLHHQLYIQMLLTSLVL